MHGWYWHGWWGDWLGMLGMIVFWIAVIVLLVWLVRSWRSGSSATSTTSPPAPHHVGDPVAVVKQRYARGEIDRQEYLEKMKDLGAPPDASG